MSGIFRPRQGVQRVTANAGNRAFIAGGRGPNRAKKLPDVVPASDVPVVDMTPPSALSALATRVARAVKGTKR